MDKEWFPFVPCCSQWNHKTSQGENAITQLFLDPFWIFLVQINTQSIKQDALIQLSNSQFKICSSVQHFALVFQTPILKSCQSIGKHWWHVSPLVTIGDISVHWLTLVILVASCFIVPMNTIANRQLKTLLSPHLCFFSPVWTQRHGWNIGENRFYYLKPYYDHLLLTHTGET